MTDRPGPGRPAVTAERRAQILNAFIDLLAEHGLESLSLDDVARAAGVQRSVIRHFVGNRADLIRSAVDVLADRYAALIGAQLGDEPSFDRIVDHLFSDRWSSGMAVEDTALGQLVREAAHDERTRERIKAMYDRLLAELAGAIRRAHPEVSRQEAREHAYTIVCAAEHNVVMRNLGYPSSLSRAASRSVRRFG